jgi:hypothetical protein
MRVPRFTVRRLMLAIAILALPLGIWGRREYRRITFERLASDHRSRIKGLILGRGGPFGYGLWGLESGSHPARLLTDRERQLDRYHMDLFRKYFEAARSPMSPVPPDPPEPE